MPGWHLQADRLTLFVFEAKAGSYGTNQNKKRKLDLYKDLILTRLYDAPDRTTPNVRLNDSFINSIGTILI